MLGVLVSGTAVAIFSRSPSLVWAEDYLNSLEVISVVVATSAAIAVGRYFVKGSMVRKTSVKSDLLLGILGASAVFLVGGLFGELAIVLLLLFPCLAGALLLIGISRLVSLADAVFWGLAAIVLTANSAAVADDFGKGLVALCGIQLIGIRVTLGAHPALGGVIGVAVFGITTAFISQDPLFSWLSDFSLAWEAIGGVIGVVFTVGVSREVGAGIVVSGIGAASAGMFGFFENWGAAPVALAALAGALFSVAAYNYIVTGTLAIRSAFARA